MKNSKPQKKRKISEIPKPVQNKIEETKRKVSTSSGSSADSEDEELVSRIGKIPLKWYEEFRHLGYDIQAQKVQKQMQSFFEMI